MEHEGSELDSLAGVSSLKEDLVRDPAMDDHSSEMLIDMGQGFLNQSDLKKESSIQSQNADDDSRSGLCWWEQSIHSVSDTPTRKLMEVSIQNDFKPPAPNSLEKDRDNFDQSVDNFQPSTSDLAALASPVLPTSSLHSSSLSSIFSLTQVNIKLYMYESWNEDWSIINKESEWHKILNQIHDYFWYNTS